MHLSYIMSAMQLCLRYKKIPFRSLTQRAERRHAQLRGSVVAKEISVCCRDDFTNVGGPEKAYRASSQQVNFSTQRSSFPAWQIRRFRTQPFVLFNQWQSQWLRMFFASFLGFTFLFICLFTVSPTLCGSIFKRFLIFFEYTSRLTYVWHDDISPR